MAETKKAKTPFPKHVYSKPHLFESLQWELNCKMSFREDKTSNSAGILLLEMAGCGAHSGTTHVWKVPGSFTS